MLGLKLPTDPRWVDLAGKSLDEIFTDHAYCEQKAASTCISLIQMYPDRTELVEKLAPIVTEEWGHFRQVLQMMKERNATLGRQRKDEYVNKLFTFERKQAGRDERLMDKLLIAAMIEARSCERFRLLSEGLADEQLRDFYHRFMVAEAGHYRLFLDLAETYMPADKVKVRWQQLIELESIIIKNITLSGKRIH